jgi:hypothetical protein
MTAVSGKNASIAAEISRLAEKFGISEDHAFNLWIGKYVAGLDEADALEAALIEGANDKGIDVFHVDAQREIVFIAQCKFSDKHTRSGKESDVNTLAAALTWLGNPAALKKEGRPELANAADEFSAAVKNGFGIELIYAHLGPRSVNVDKYTHLLNASPDHIENNRQFQYHNIDTLSAIDKEFNNPELRIPDEEVSYSGNVPFRQKQDHYDATVVAIPGSELRRIYELYSDRLFDRNVRLYLGARKGSVNAGIIKTLNDTEDRKNFWAYNNGITIICDSFDIGDNKIRLENFSIINGCQTTVSISRSSADLQDVLVLAKVIRIRHENVDDVIRYNNSQNPIKAWDIASQHPVHRRLKDEFDALQKPILYRTRRGDKPKAIGRFKSGTKIRQIESDRLAQYRAAFAGDPVLAWKSKSEIFEPQHHEKFYPQDLRVEEALFSWTLGEIVNEEVVHSLKDATSDQHKLILRNGGTFFVLACAAKIFLKRNGATTLAKAQADSITSKTTASKLGNYAKYSVLTYIDAVEELSQSREIDIVPLLKSRDFMRQVLDKVERKLDRDSLAEKYIEEALPEASLS